MIGRPPSCECGECKKCKHRLYMRRWYQGKTLEERRAWIALRNRETVKANDRARYYRNREQRTARMDEWERQNPEKVREANRRWQERNPEKRKAHHAVRSALRAGRLTRRPCEVCGEPKVQAHHDDYSKPLDVRWLCAAHHGFEHRRYEDSRAA